MSSATDPRAVSVRHRVTLLPDGREFLVDPGEDILTAGLRQGVDIAYGCRHGHCTTCKHVVVDGEVFQDGASPYALSDGEREAGAVLLCSSYALSALVLSPAGSALLDDAPELIPPVDVVARFVGMAPVAPHLTEVRMRLVSPLTFRAGQHVEVELPATTLRRSYSIATFPGEAEVRLLLDAARLTTRRAFDRLGPGDPVFLRGPFGRLAFRPSSRPVLMVAMGAGIAPLLSMLRESRRQGGHPATVRLYYGLCGSDAVPYADELENLVEVVPVRLDAGLSPIRRLGPLVQTVGRAVTDASAHEAYVAGDVGLCDAVTALLLAKGLPERRLHVQRFYSIAA